LQSVKEPRIKASYATLSLTIFLVGCSACAERKPAKAIQTSDGRQKVARVKEALHFRPDAGQGPQFRLSNFLNKTVRDKTGDEVARVEDLAIGANGQVISVTLVPISGNGAKITIPFERLKVLERNGVLYFETDVVHNPETAHRATGTSEETLSKTAEPEQNSGGGTPKDLKSKAQ
jgi:sporulation protein YlmC with PRC-barrel domain